MMNNTTKNICSYCYMGVLEKFPENIDMGKCSNCHDLLYFSETIEASTKNFNHVRNCMRWLTLNEYYPSVTIRKNILRVNISMLNENSIEISKYEVRYRSELMLESDMEEIRQMKGK